MGSINISLGKNNDNNNNKIIRSEKNSPISFMNNHINGTTNFAITRYTDNGAYVRGDVLFYKVNGVEIYAPIDSIIMINTVNNTVFIKDTNNVSKILKPEYTISGQYIIMYTFLYSPVEDMYNTIWESYEGCLAAYDAIKSNICNIDPEQSFVFTDQMTFNDSINVKEFVQYVKNANLVDDDFDISDYFDGPDYV